MWIPKSAYACVPYITAWHVTKNTDGLCTMNSQPWFENTVFNLQWDRLYIYFLKIMCINGPLEFKPILFKGQLNSHILGTGG